MDDRNSLLSLANQTLERCHSTNDLAKRLAEAGFPSGTWVSAKIQDGGRGRLGRKWESIEGNLFLSLIARFEQKAHLSWVPLTTAVAIRKVLNSEYPEIPIKIKWPNDLGVFQGNQYAKLGGILCEASGSGARSYIIIGIGINCIQAPALALTEQFVTSLTGQRGGIKIYADQIRQPIISSLIQSLSQLNDFGPEWVRRDYERNCLFQIGTQVRWGSPIQVGEIHGLGPYGELQVLNSLGKIQSLFSEEVSVRFH